MAPRFVIDLKKRRIFRFHFKWDVFTNLTGMPTLRRRLLCRWPIRRPPPLRNLL
jgi:hypothetical protein